MKIKSFVLTAGILVFCVSSLFSLKHHSAQAANSQMPEPEITVEASYAQLAQYQPTTAVIGQAQAVQQAVIKNELAGKIAKLNFTSGQLVNREQVLLEFNHQEEDALLKSIQADVVLYKRKLSRFQALHAKGQISDEKVDDVQALLTKAHAEIERITAVIDKKIIRAPFSGFMGIHDLTVGQYLDSNSEITNVTGDNDFIWVDFNVPQTYQSLAAKDQVQVQIKSKQAQMLTAEITSIAPRLNAETRQLKYRAKVSKSEAILKPNQLVKVFIPTAAQDTVLLIPQQAVIRDQLGDYVYQLQLDEKSSDKTYRAAITKVELGDRIADKIVVNAGIDERSMIAAKGAFKLWPGAKAVFTSPQSSVGGK